MENGAIMFAVRQVHHREEYENLMGTVNEWRQVAKEKATKAVFIQQEILEDAESIAELITQIPYSSVENRVNKIFIYTTECLQSIAVMEEEGNNLRIKRLLANPSNLFSGAGKILVHHLFQECISQGKEGVNAESMSASLPFYDKMGFKRWKDCSEEEGGEVRITALEIKKSLTIE